MPEMIVGIIRIAAQAEIFFDSICLPHANQCEVHNEDIGEQIVETIDLLRHLYYVALDVE